MYQRIVSLFILIGFFSVSPLLANPMRGTVVLKTGKVQLLIKPRKKSSNKGSEALYEGLYYKLKKVRIGSKLKKGEVLQTGTDGKIKVLFANGDQLSIGPGTSFRLSWDKSKSDEENKSMINLFYGKMRAIISKKGPRKRLRVQTPTAVAGVRGTDFFVSHIGDRGVELAVLRGEVEFASRVPSTKAKKQKVTVQPGDLAVLSMPSSEKEKMDEVPEIKIKQASKESLMEIQGISTIQKGPEFAQLSEAKKKKIRKLEERAIANVVEEVKENSPGLLKNLKDGQKNINTAVIAKLYKAAPAEDPNKKPSEGELNDIGSDIYKKFFQ